MLQPDFQKQSCQLCLTHHLQESGWTAALGFSSMSLQLWVVWRGKVTRTACQSVGFEPPLGSGACGLAAEGGSTNPTTL